MAEQLAVEITVMVQDGNGYTLQKSVVHLRDVTLELVNEIEETETVNNWKTHRFTGKKTFTISGMAGI